MTIALSAGSLALLVAGLILGLSARAHMSNTRYRGLYWKVPRETFDSHGAYVRFMVGTSCTIAGSALLVIASLAR